MPEATTRPPRTEVDSAWVSKLRSVLLVEDHDATRAAIAQALSERADLSVVAVATGREARAAVARAGVSIAAVDLRLRGESGVDVIRELAARGVPSIALTAMGEGEAVIAAIRAGARGYLLKSEPFERLRAALDAALSGEAPLSSPVVKHVVEALRPVDLPVALTARERDVLVALARGLTYAECAEMLDVKLATVQGYVKVLYGKIEVETKAEATAWAMRHGLVR